MPFAEFKDTFWEVGTFLHIVFFAVFYVDYLFWLMLLVVFDRLRIEESVGRIPDQVG